MSAVERQPSGSFGLRQEKRLGELLLENGLLTPEQLDAALVEQRRQRRPLGQLLLSQGLVDEKALAGVLSVHFDVPQIDFARTRVEKDALALIPEAYARQHVILPVRLEKDELQVATVDPGDLALFAELKVLTRKRIKPLIGVRSEIEQAISQAYKLRSGVDRHVRSFAETFQPVTAGRRLAEVNKDAPVVQIVDLIIAEGAQERASDIHIEPQQDQLRIRFRIDGVLHDATQLPATLAAPIASRIKLLANLDIVDRHHSQDGQIQTAVDGRPLDIRVGTIETIWGEKVVLRLLERSRSILRLDSLGFGAPALQLFRGLVQSPYGMILVTGPTGSGKTTTLYSALNELDHVESNIMTIEDPVEYTFEGVNQIQINRLAGITFANGLRAILRQDPDAILVGEIRDKETAEISVQSALTGHLVLSSLHATDAIGAIYRFIEMGIESFMVSSAVVGVLAQRLVRRICTQCGVPYEPAPEELSFYRSLGGQGSSFVRGTGCAFCAHTGFRGRIGVFEVLRMSDAIKRLLVRDAPPEALRDRAIGEGMTTLRRAGLMKIDEGLTTIAEVMRSVHLEDSGA
ncbi:MAG TPA: GspE/PulE family protein [Candidatus Dormibacteraeota bacterium]|nr:GspE/PulE family protein [Candidatus Dormibacteraeota bacterium]